MTFPKNPILLVLACWLTSMAASAADTHPPLLVCYPGGAVNEQDAKGAMDALLRVVERVGQWPQNSFTSQFTVKADECKRLLTEQRPGFAITSLGLFLELRDRHNLVPVVQPKIHGRVSDRYRVMVRQGKYKTLDELKGKALGGTVLEEPAFIGRIVFAGKIDPAGFFKLTPTRQAIRALRALDKGEIDAVLLNEQQYSALGSLQLAHPLEAVFASEDIPLMGLVADGKATTAEERARFAKALEGMCADTEGKKLCEMFGVESFVAADRAAFEPMIQQWAGGN
ncbi:MAG: phosphate/phosphite/phosphonate ABC transporter substrate-binding protein [Methylococcaceae bacterium]|nr:phosphate/phosphite/phosphonate ABC transporter substrate-binding protein [Methylococcaceae bacterium]